MHVGTRALTGISMSIGDELYDTLDLIEELRMINSALERYRNGMDKKAKRPTKVQLPSVQETKLLARIRKENEKQVAGNYP